MKMADKNRKSSIIGDRSGRTHSLRIYVYSYYIFSTNITFVASIPASLLLLFALFTANLRITGPHLICRLFSLAGGRIGVCYGMLGNNLPSAREVVDFYKANNVKRMRLHDPNQEALEALRDSGIDLMLGVPNTDLHRLATSADDARQWVENSVSKFYPSVNIKYIAVGNEVNAVDGANRQYAPHVLPTIQNVYRVIRARGLHEIKVSTSIDMTSIRNSYHYKKKKIDFQRR